MHPAIRFLLQAIGAAVLIVVAAVVFRAVYLMAAPVTTEGMEDVRDMEHVVPSCLGQTWAPDDGARERQLVRDRSCLES